MERDYGTTTQNVDRTFTTEADAGPEQDRTGDRGAARAIPHDGARMLLSRVLTERAEVFRKLAQ